MQEFAIDCSGVNAKYMVVSEKTEDVRNNVYPVSRTK